MAEKVKRYWAFAWSKNGAGGGMEDFIDSYDSPGEALDAVDEAIAKWADQGHAIDSETAQKYFDLDGL